MKKGEKMSDESRAKVSAGQKARWADPEYRAKMMKMLGSDERKARLKAEHGTPEAREQKSIRSKAHWADPENRAKMVETQKTRWADSEERREALRADMGRLQAGQEKWLRDPRHKAVHSSISRNLWRNPEYRKKQEATRSDPEHIKKRSQPRVSYRNYPEDPLALRFGKRKGVYVVYSPGLDIVKIGISENMRGRLRTLQAGSPVRLQYAALCECPVGQAAAIGVEKHMHELFIDQRAWGEHFNITASAAVAALAAAADAGGHYLLIDAECL